MEVTEIGLLDAAISRRPMLSFLSGEQCIIRRQGCIISEYVAGGFGASRVCRVCLM
jgi:hypothetical protein